MFCNDARRRRRKSSRRGSSVKPSTLLPLLLLLLLLLSFKPHLRLYSMRRQAEAITIKEVVEAGDDEMQSTHLSLFPVRRLPAGLRVTDSVFWNSKHDKAGFWHCNSKAAAEEDLECVT